MEIICRRCEGNAFRILPEEIGTVTAECVVCGALTLIEIPSPSAWALPLGRRRRRIIGCQPANGYRHEGLRAAGSW